MDCGSGLREEDLMRHLADLVMRSYEGAESWPDRLAVFHRAVHHVVTSDPRDLAVLDGTVPTVIV